MHFKGKDMPSLFSIFLDELRHGDQVLEVRPGSTSAPVSGVKPSGSANTLSAAATTYSAKPPPPPLTPRKPNCSHRFGSPRRHDAQVPSS